MSRRAGGKSKSGELSARSLLRLIGRVGIWAVVAMLLVRGLGAVLAPPPRSVPTHHAAEAIADPPSASLAVRFARAYLGDPSSQALSPLLAEGARVVDGRPPEGSASGIAQAEVSAVQELGGGQEVITVACEFRDARTLYLAVPISRSPAGEVAVQGAPWMVAAPSTAGVAPERPRPIAGSGAASIQALVEKFVPAYAMARSPGDLSYFLAPGASVVPLAGALEPLGAPGAAAQLGEGEGRGRTVVVAARFLDPASGAIYRLAYRLALIRRDRWYVRAVEGAPS